MGKSILANPKDIPDLRDTYTEATTETDISKVDFALLAIPSSDAIEPRRFPPSTYESRKT